MKYIISWRELEIIRSMADGFDDSKIAHELRLKKETVLLYKKKILKRVGVNDPTEAMSALTKNGFELED